MTPRYVWYCSRAFSKPLGHAVAAYRTTDGARAWFVDSAHGNNIMGVAVSPDGATVASASWDGTLKLWRASDGNALRTITETGPASSVAFSPGSSTVAGGTTAGDLRSSVPPAARRSRRCWPRRATRGTSFS